MWAQGREAVYNSVFCHVSLFVVDGGASFAGFSA